MCRLFGLATGSEPVKATFWLLEAPDSLAQQSRRNPDGYGLATYHPDVDVEKRPVAAYEDEEFAREAKERESPVFLAHVRYASTGKVELRNTHPFEQEGRVFAHNGHIAGLDALDERLGDHRRLVLGDTDSERFFALVTKEIDANGGDPGAALAAAARWVAANLPLYALNCLLATSTDMWALRYPDTHDLLMLERGEGGPSGARHFDGASAAGRIRVRSGALAGCRAVVFATEPMDEDRGWRNLDPGELVHVDRDLTVTSEVAIDHAPAHPLRLEDLEPHAAKSQS
ncbi:MAG TPA: class II glutamine amidotransferase [Thermoleophilaceae bacterium]|nr:class II glutamine amidotransferase [Thermoleophilaceae bacterium]